MARCDGCQTLLAIVRSLVNHQADVIVEALPSVTGTLFRIQVNPDDVGQVIGRSGRTARSIRVVMGEIGTRFNESYTVEIVLPLNPKEI